MFERLRHGYREARRRLDRVRRQRGAGLRRWLENTRNLLHLSVLVVVPLLVGVVTWLSNASTAVSFFVYPPLASGTYTLFADPDGRYSSPRKFAGGIATGAFSGWIALEMTARYWYAVPPDQFQVHAGAAALGVFLTGAVTWWFELEQPTAFSAALLVLVTRSSELTYVGGLVVLSLVVAGVFALWRRRFYRERARYLFQSTGEPERLLVPVRGGAPDSFGAFVARLAAARGAEEVVLVETVPPSAIEEADTAVTTEQAPGSVELAEEPPEEVVREAEAQVTERTLGRLEPFRSRIERAADVPCEFVVAVERGTAGETVLETAEVERCDLVVSPYESEGGRPTRFVETVLCGDTDAVAFGTSTDRSEWSRALVVIRSPGDLAHAMLDFASRLVTEDGTVSACACVDGERERREAEAMLDDVVEPLTDPIEMRIADGPIASFLEANAAHYDLAVLGADADRSAASRLRSGPTFERVPDLECDLAVVHRG